MKRYFIVTDATAEQVKERTGLDAHQTHLGALVERPAPFDLGRAMEQIDRALYPNKPRCICGKFAVIHRGNCPVGMAIN